MKSQALKTQKLKVKIDKRLNGIDVTKLFPEQLAQANKDLANIKLPKTK
ncbi:hypothetical protein KK062_27565 [Fulvivirgaceae bacterium PWU5]|uniref:Uncharacterized protein n=2 Tax=Dawidia cretensis TaxID=2782350 RepID=A0AAP2E3R9_9BACT|nr:hypothetical protein [Dawidia cretensis]